ncbi:F-box/LRR-repeat protein At3g26922-like [Rhodamnia argentea]|uniref:F-box/LRR-repeat protein At3g26922-like n=1 Tax=Rhodamnia argentea TaxID=178133 RepID=A0A8B8MV91_9MYRT|nr:F-box/LRR-repeat protein At3g26922-like [Rhodamnia argentea]XP_030514022.1 F-box/LRR-repeat protein At3g26922-like [Rhodamnia argentea]
MDARPLAHEAKCPHLNDTPDVSSHARICDLPDEILLRILGLLSLKEVVRTSLLSKRWEYLWTSISSLVFREDESNRRFMNFVDRALLLGQSTPLKLFSLNYVIDGDEYVSGDESRINSWITAAIRRNVQKLQLHLGIEHLSFNYSLPSCIFRCETLTELHLLLNGTLRLPSSVRLKNLRVLALEYLHFADDRSMEQLFSCPSLEMLSLEYCIWPEDMTLHISAPNLLSLSIVERDSFLDIGSHSHIKILGSCMKSFDYYGELLDDYDISGSPSLEEVIINLFHPSNVERKPDQCAQHAYKLLKDLSHVKLLTLAEDILEDLDENRGILDLDSIPIFGYLTKLKFTTRNVDLDSEAFQVLLSKCTILRSLEFEAGVSIESVTAGGILDPAPQCFLKSLKEITIGYFEAADYELLAVTILLGAAAVLEELVIHCTEQCSKNFHGDSMEALLALPRASSRCAIRFLPCEMQLEE